MNDPLPVPAASNTFERIKRVSPEGHDFWSARDLARVLEYLNFRNFQPVIEKAKEACAKSGHTVADHFAEMLNMVGIGSGAQRELEDWALSRYACLRRVHPWLKKKIRHLTLALEKCLGAAPHPTCGHLLPRAEKGISPFESERIHLLRPWRLGG